MAFMFNWMMDPRPLAYRDEGCEFASKTVYLESNGEGHGCLALHAIPTSPEVYFNHDVLEDKCSSKHWLFFQFELRFGLAMW